MSIGWINRTFEDADGLSTHEMMVLIILADYANEDGESFPAVKTLAFRSRMSRRGIQQVTQSLREKGRLEVFEAAGRKGTNVYRIIGPDERQKGGAPDAPPPLEGANTMRGGGAPGARGGRTPCAGGGEPRAPEPSLEPSLNHQGTTIPAREAQGGLLVSVDDAFSEFWRAYPRKVGKGTARKSFDKALKRAPAEVILQGMYRYRDECRGKETRFIAHASSWLNGDRWEDEPGANRTGERTYGEQFRDQLTPPDDRPPLTAEDMARLIPGVRKGIENDDEGGDE